MRFPPNRNTFIIFRERNAERERERESSIYLILTFDQLNDPSKCRSRFPRASSSQWTCGGHSPSTSATISIPTYVETTSLASLPLIIPHLHYHSHHFYRLPLFPIGFNIFFGIFLFISPIYKSKYLVGKFFLVIDY